MVSHPEVQSPGQASLSAAHECYLCPISSLCAGEMDTLQINNIISNNTFTLSFYKLYFSFLLISEVNSEWNGMCGNRQLKVVCKWFQNQLETH